MALYGFKVRTVPINLEIINNKTDAIHKMKQILKMKKEDMSSQWKTKQTSKTNY